MQNYSKALLSWYDKHHRNLPWRITPAAQKAGQKADPYRIWLSEVMLQQTTVEAVKAYFEKFVTRWPTIKALASAPLDDILKAWAGLGYYSRARNLKACADIVAHDYDGIFPDCLTQLRALPGIGDYTAAAIMAIAFNRPATVVDGNVERIVSRLFMIDTPLPAGKKNIRESTQQITPPKRAGDFAQAMMDLGSSICTPKKPDCPLCPLQNLCQAHAHNKPEYFPVKAVKKEKPLRTGIAFIAQSKNNRILLQKRGPKGLLAEMSEVPNHFGEGASKDDLTLAPLRADWHYQGDITHIFTHFRLEMSVYLAVEIDENMVNYGWWAEIDTLDSEALPTVMKKAVKIALPTAFNKHIPKNV